MLGLKAPSDRQLALVRVALGGYLCVHFATLVPYAEELFSSVGMLPDPEQLPTAWLPNLLSVDAPRAAGWSLVALSVSSLLFAIGVRRRLAALVLWVGWFTLFHRNPLADGASVPYVGWLLLAYAAIPNVDADEDERSDARGPATPLVLYGGAWLLLGLGYSLGGLHELGSSSWLDGSALSHLLESPLARDTPLRGALLAQPEALRSAATWAVIALQLSALPLFVLPAARRWAWLGLTSMQLAASYLLDCVDVTAALLVFHLFVFEARWLPRLRRRSREPASPRFL